MTQITAINFLSGTLKHEEKLGICLEKKEIFIFMSSDEELKSYHTQLFWSLICLNNIQTLLISQLIASLLFLDLFFYLLFSFSNANQLFWFYLSCLYLSRRPLRLCSDQLFSLCLQDQVILVAY